MKTGIIGARGAGKSTVFHALTGLAPIPGTAEGRNRARPGQIKVADPRLDFLEAAYGSKKKVPVELTILDFAPNPKEQKEGAALDPSLLPLMRDIDALLIVIPQFAGRRKTWSRRSRVSRASWCLPTSIRRSGGSNDSRKKRAATSSARRWRK